MRMNTQEHDGSSPLSSPGLPGEVSRSDGGGLQPTRSITELTNDLLEDLLNPTLTSLELCQLHSLTLPQLATILGSETFKHAVECIERIASKREKLIDAQSKPLAKARLLDLLKSYPETDQQRETHRKAATTILRASPRTPPRPAPKAPPRTPPKKSPEPTPPRSVEPDTPIQKFDFQWDRLYHSPLGTLSVPTTPNRRHTMPRIPLVNTLDKERILTSLASSSGTPPDYISQMINRIYSAIPVEPTEIPDQLVTMNSIVRIQDTETNEIDIYALVYNEDFDHQAEWISVNSKLGSALLGRSVGDEIEIPSRRGSHTVRIVGLEYQPEKSGHFDR